MFIQAWIKNSCESNWPHLKVREFQDFRCLKGVSLKNSENEADELEITIKELSSSTTQVSVSIDVGSASGKHYSAKAILEENLPKEDSISIPLPNLAALDCSNFYDGEVLFHKDEFQVIKEIHGLGPEGIVGDIISNDEDNYQKDLVFDGGLQLALLWMWRNYSAGSIPMALSQIKYFAGELDALTRCTVVAKNVGPQKSKVDIFFHNQSGAKVAGIIDLELIAHFQKEFNLLPESGQTVRV